ncbi:hypothetical protein [Cohaesibacter haloalkalitolerans]|uniref:hypothetical protein n=1 Tax=Cohaesibacter haloalkalitolerans TaxID=1162980 RepID=UPI000E650FD5|nr:hypothetical protein [Cohaesibacter haloalkalitolerans]
MIDTPWMAGSLGALLGLLIAVFANIVVLPAVLRAQENGFLLGRETAPGSMSKETMARLTRFFYRVPMPVLFAFVGWFAGLTAFGG